jgi:hypothetical protein
MRDRKCGQHDNKLISILKSLPLLQLQAQNSIDITLSVELSVKGNFGTVEWSENETSERVFSVFLLSFLPCFLPVTLYDVT